MLESRAINVIAIGVEAIHQYIPYLNLSYKRNNYLPWKKYDSQKSTLNEDTTKRQKEKFLLDQVNSPQEDSHPFTLLQAQDR